ncbi:unnamed protein product [Prorocentrum cordatum]|uniref:Nudix hydrolase domain-containing protein n=1 Tax=Prorocentrum cordatum TaxID=2364126 RepID=A0ABN9V6G6_9DINO|nr:unnamed protein product [Polarella glacialis]
MAGPAALRSAQGAHRAVALVLTLLRPVARPRRDGWGVAGPSVARPRWRGRASASSSSAATGPPVYPRAAVAVTVCRQRPGGGGAMEYLLAKRAHEPSKGCWMLPGGKIELGETVLEAAARELAEETGLAAESGLRVHPWATGVTDAIYPRGWQAGDAHPLEFHYVLSHVLAFCTDPSARAAPGDDALEIRWCSLGDLEGGALAPLAASVLPVLRHADSLVRSGAWRAEDAVDVRSAAGNPVLLLELRMCAAVALAGVLALGEQGTSAAAAAGAAEAAAAAEVSSEDALSGSRLLDPPRVRSPPASSKLRSRSAAPPQPSAPQSPPAPAAAAVAAAPTPAAPPDGPCSLSVERVRLVRPGVSVESQAPVGIRIGQASVARPPPPVAQRGRPGAVTQAALSAGVPNDSRTTSPGPAPSVPSGRAASHDEHASGGGPWPAAALGSSVAQVRRARMASSQALLCVDEELRKLAAGSQGAHSAFQSRTAGISEVLESRQQAQAGHLGELRAFQRECQERLQRLNAGALAAASPGAWLGAGPIAGAPA